MIVCLKEHIELYLDFEKFRNRIQQNIDSRIEIVCLDKPTASQSETISACIEKAEISGSIFIKDCDNEFSYDFSGGNEIAVVDLNSVDLIDAKNKSYVQINDLEMVINIVEKQVISNLFCCGGYGIECAETFQRNFKSLSLEIGDEIFVSHVIYNMILNGETFQTKLATEYTDWGTKNEFLEYFRKHVTVFCDVDGVLLNSGSSVSKTGWQTAPIQENINTLIELRDRGYLYLIVTSSRPISQKDQTLKQLADVGLVPDDSLFGLPYGKRYLINDFTPTNPYPSALAINLESNSSKLESLFDFCK